VKCARCSAEVPGQAQFCMRCGTAVAPVSAVVAAARRPSRRPLWIGLALLAVAALAAGGYRLLNPAGASKVVDASGQVPVGADLTGRSGRVAAGPDLSGRSGRITPPPPEPADVVDYLKFLKDVERQRVALVKQQTAGALGMSASLPGSNLLAEMQQKEEDIQRSHEQTYEHFQAKIMEWQGQWNILSQHFLSKPPPQSCQQLRDKYYDMLGKTAGAMVSLANSLSQAFSGNAEKALESLSSMRGTASQSIDDACAAADEELASVCGKFRLRKDFDIKPDGGGASLFGGLGALR